MVAAAADGRMTRRPFYGGRRPGKCRPAEQRDELAPSQVKHAAPLPRCHRHHTPATGCLGSVGLPHLQLADGGLNRPWGRPELF